MWLVQSWHGQWSTLEHRVHHMYATMATVGARETAEQASAQHLCEGCRIELTGLGSEDLNGQRGGISGSYLADRGCWPVVVDGTGRELSCKPTNLKGLASCGHCGAEKRLDKKTEI